MESGTVTVSDLPIIFVSATTLISPCRLRPYISAQAFKSSSTPQTMRWGNIQVFIKSQPEGRVLPEYQVETLDGGRTVACYIPSEVGKVRTLLECVFYTRSSPLVDLRDLLARRHPHGPARLHLPVRGGRPESGWVVLRARDPQRDSMGDPGDCGASEALPVRPAGHDRCASHSLL